MTGPLYIPMTEALATELGRLGADHATMDQLEASGTGDRILAVVGPAAAAEDMARSIVSRGVPVARLLFVPTDEDDEDLARQLDGARHLFWRDVQPLRVAPQAGSFKTYKTGISVFDDEMKWRWRLRELGVVAGPYSSGKSTLIQQLAFNFVKENSANLDNSGALICAWEDEASEMRGNLERFSKTIYTGAEKGLLDKIQYVCRDPNEERLVPWYIDLVNFHYAKYRTRFFTLDPWNEMDHKKDIRQLETDYVRDAMKDFRRLVDKLGIILLIATHVPAKMIKGDGSIEPFKIAHSFGSGNFGNKADRGICIVRTKAFNGEKCDNPNWRLGHTIIRIDKSKVESSMGPRGTVALRFNEGTFSYSRDGKATAAVQDVWKD